MRFLLPVLCLLSLPASATEPLDRTSPDPDLGAPDPVERNVGQIINGRAGTAEEWPMAGGLLAGADVTAFGQQIPVLMFMCSSTLIAPDVVLTASHCVDEELLQAQTGGFATFDNLVYHWATQADLSGFALGGPTTPPPGSVVGWDWPLHPDWVGAENLQVGIAANHDIALIFLEEPVLDVPYAYLPLPEEADQLVEGASVVIVGWGNQEPVPPNQQPKAGKVGIKQVAESTIGAVGEAEFQVGLGPDSKRKCQGDSGGPTFQQVQTDTLESWRVIGVTSHAWDETLCENTGGVDTRVDAYLDWIDQEMRARCGDGRRAWCDVPGIIPPPFPEDDALGLDEEARACACNSNAVPSGWLAGLGLLALLVLGRRRAR